MTDSERLRKLYEARVPTGMSMAEFGTVFGIGTKAMVWQYITGYRPLNYDAASKFARGLRCTIADISPELARRLRVDIFPVLGKVSAKASLVLLLLIPPYVENKAEVAFNITKNIIHIALLRLRLIWLKHGQSFLTR